MTPDILFPLVFGWSAFGLFVSCSCLVLEIVEPMYLSIPQTVVWRLVCGPAMWLYGLWEILGLFGKRR